MAFVMMSVLCKYIPSMCASMLLEPIHLLAFNEHFYVSDDIPAPTNITLNDNKILQWSHAFQPQLPPDFELVHNYDISNKVHAYDKSDVITSVDVPENYLNLENGSLVLNVCEQEKFSVQAVINNVHSKDSSFVGFEGKLIHTTC